MLFLSRPEERLEICFFLSTMWDTDHQSGHRVTALEYRYWSL
ncbi:mCG147335 [Mus musculus]|nr:mCG147335 [Mus musculus]